MESSGRDSTQSGGSTWRALSSAMATSPIPGLQDENTAPAAPCSDPVPTPTTAITPAALTRTMLTEDVTVPATPEQIAEYMSTVLARKPEISHVFHVLTQVRAADNKLEELFERHPADPDVLLYTIDNPRLYLDEDYRGNPVLACTFYSTCRDDACEGTLVKRSGVWGNNAKEVLCPTHWERLHNKLVAERTRALVELSGIPLRYQPYTLENWPGNAGIRSRVEAIWAKDPTRSLLLYGPPGTYKTSLCVSLLRRAHDHGRKGLFLNVTDALLRIRSTFSDKSKARVGPNANLERRMIDTPLLVLDDFGKQKASDWVGETLYTVLNERGNALRPTIVTTNYSIGQLASDPIAVGESLEERLGGDITALAIVDRLIDKDVYAHIYLGGTSGRMRTRMSTPLTRESCSEL